MMMGFSTDAEAIQAELRGAWGMVLLRGVLNIIIGLLLIAEPGRTLVAFTNVIALFLLIDGIFTLVSSLMGRNWWSLVGAILMIIVAIFVLGHPIFTTILATATLLLFIGVSALIAGIMNLFGAFQNRDTLENWLWVAINAIISILFGLIVLGNSLFAGIVLLQVVGIYMIIGGILLIVLAFRFRSM